MSLKFCSIHLRIILSLPGKNQVKIPRIRKNRKKKKKQTLSDSSEILQNPSTRCACLACKKSGQNSECGVVKNSTSAEFGKLEKKKKKPNVIRCL
jgi:hypothetical protein